MNRPLIALAGLMVAGGALGGALIVAQDGGEEEVVQQVETATPSVPEIATPVPSFATKGELWRWLNVTVVIPEGSAIKPSPQDVSAELKPPTGGSALQLLLDTDPADLLVSAILIDAESGVILKDEVRDKDREAFQQVIQTVAVSELDPSTAPWPYSGTPPDAALERLGNIAFVRPPASSGIQVYYGVSDYFGPPGNGGSQEYLRITNGRSTAIVLVATGDRATANDHIEQNDALAFERYIASIRICGKDITC